MVLRFERNSEPSFRRLAVALAVGTSFQNVGFGCGRLRGTSRGGDEVGLRGVGFAGF